MNSALKSFSKLSQHPDIDIVSVDLFDTFLLRTTTPERVKFGRFGRKKAIALRQIISDNRINARYLHILRLYAAKIAYRNRRLIHGAREATLDEIYHVMFTCMAADFNVASDERFRLLEQFHQIELDMEKADLNVNEPLKTILLDAAKAGKKVIAISDMYLSCDDIRDILKDKGVLDLFDEVFVSSQFGYGKASGFLFEEVLSRFDRKPNQFAHIGDNWFSDYHVPQQKGIHAFYCPRSFIWRAMRRFRTDVSHRIHGVLE